MELARQAHEEDPVSLSRELLVATRTGDDADDLRTRLATLGPDALERALTDDDRRNAFWINVYNAAVQSLLADDPSRYGDGWIGRWRFFSAPLLTVAGRDLSLNDVEHGILRRSKVAWGLGYLPRPFPDAFERTHRVDAPDPRIHFALNCGAASCPPIASYSADGIDDELRLATESYLETTVEYDPDAGVVHLPKLFRWYRGDFGGTSGIVSFLREHGAIPSGVTPDLAWSDYDWQLDLDNYTDLSSA